jgi:hypothetical protein
VLLITDFDVSSSVWFFVLDIILIWIYSSTTNTLSHQR